MHSQFCTQPNQLRISQLLNNTMRPAVRFDFSGLGKLASDAGFVREIQQMFIDRVPKQLAQLGNAIEASDWTGIARQAHSLKATFGNLCIEPGTALLKEIEALARQQADQPELLRKLQVVASAAEAVASIFRQELSRAA